VEQKDTTINLKWYQQTKSDGRGHTDRKLSDGRGDTDRNLSDGHGDTDRKLSDGHGGTDRNLSDGHGDTDRKLSDGHGGTDRNLSDGHPCIFPPHLGWAAAASLKFHFFTTRSGQGWSCIIQTIYTSGYP
jgi:hypothetical protein